MKSILIGIVIIIATLGLTYKWWLPTALVKIGKGDFLVDKVTIDAVTVSNSSQNEMAETIIAVDGHKFINIDITVDLQLAKIDYYDFQLVKRDDYEFGMEENLGDNFQDNYFNVLPLDDNGDVANEWNINADTFKMRLTYQVPTSVTEGYLFYWGDYIGPLLF